MPLSGNRPEYWDVAKKELSISDITLSRIIDKFDDLELVSRGDIFYMLIRAPYIDHTEFAIIWDL